MVQKSTVMLYFYRFNSFPELVDIFMGIHILVDVLPLVSHELISGYTVNSSIVQQHIEGVAAVMGRVRCLNAAGLQSHVEAFSISLFRYGL